MGIGAREFVAPRLEPCELRVRGCPQRLVDPVLGHKGNKGVGGIGVVGGGCARAVFYVFGGHIAVFVLAGREPPALARTILRL
jgi:hypothetical protein